MHGIDPFDPTDPTFECPTCGARASERGVCEDCETELQNINVPRE